MPPRPAPNPAPRTAAARDALKAFYCSLCSKGYARATEFDAHQSSYDHQHKKRLKEMREMQRDPAAAQRARRAERRADGLITIKPVSLGGPAPADGERARPQQGPGAGFKKGGFKSAFGAADKVVRVEGEGDAEVEAEEEAGAGVREVESESEDDEDRYDPWRPTDCSEACPGRVER